jgi:hypothetical protein
MSTIVASIRAGSRQPVKDWESFSLQTGHVVFQGRYYCAWIKGHFVGAYDSLDDAVESLRFRNGGLKKRVIAKT